MVLKSDQDAKAALEEVRESESPEDPTDKTLIDKALQVRDYWQRKGRPTSASNAQAVADEMVTKQGVRLRAQQLRTMQKQRAKLSLPSSEVYDEEALTDYFLRLESRRFESTALGAGQDDTQRQFELDRDIREAALVR